MERLWDALLRIANHFGGLFLPAGSQYSLTSLGLALVVAVVVLGRRHWRAGRPLRLKALRRALLPHRVLRSPSTGVDVGYFFFNTFVYAGIFGWAVVSYQFLTNAVIGGLVSVFGPVAPLLPLLAARAAVTVLLFFAYELGYWFDHFLKHRVPFLWEVHKVHHSAQVLTPLTASRMHPLDTLVFVNILSIAAATTNGVASYLFGDTSTQYALSGSNILLVLFIHAYVHLQHSHVWIAFRGLAGRIFLSPAHHQIHHSADPRHFNTNLGSCLAIWDWAFGTLHMPARSREKLTFGVEPYRHMHTLTGELIAPFGRSWRAIFRGGATDVELLPAREQV